MIKYLTKVEEELYELPSFQDACWIFIQPDFTGTDLIQWAHQLRIPGNYLTDVLDAEKRPRYETHEDLKYLLLRTPVLVPVEDEEDELYRTAPIGIVIKPDYVLVICAFDSPVLQTFLQNTLQQFDPTDQSLFVLRLLGQNVDYYLDCLKNLDQRRDQLEKQLFKSRQTTELQRLLGIDKSLLFFVNSLIANDLLKKKIWKVDLLNIRQNSEKSALFEEIRMDNVQALDTANMYTHILNGIMDTYGTIVSTNLNVTIGRLTAITIVLMVPTLVASFYGMNVSLPFEKQPFAFFGILIFAILMAILIAWYFLRRRFF
jgi:magnesium transporter